MLPSFFVEVENFPLNTNGKIDVSKLPQVEYNYEKGNLQDNGSTTLEKVVNIWSEVLNRPINEEDSIDCLPLCCNTVIDTGIKKNICSQTITVLNYVVTLTSVTNSFIIKPCHFLN